MDHPFVTRDRPGRTRIKLCGFTRDEDVDAASALDIDAIGFVFYPASPRIVTIDAAARLAARVPPHIATVGLFVDASAAAIDAVRSRVPLDAIQFHGDEVPADLDRIDAARIKAARVTEGLDLLAFARSFAAADLLLLDAHVSGYGGEGRTFDWSLIPASMRDDTTLPPIVLGGGLDANNVTEALVRVKPFGVDVSSGIESARGIKDAGRMAEFVSAVRASDATRASA